MARQTNAAYWAQRMKNMEDALLDQSYSYVENLEKQFATAQAEIERQMARWYQRFATNNEIDLAEAKRLLNSKELKEFHWTVAEYIAYGEQNAIDGAWMKQLENASARVHISRLEALKLQLQQQAEVLYSNQLDYVDAAARKMYEGSYYHTAFELQKGLGVGWTMQAINEETITKAQGQDGRVALNWTSVNGATNYAVYTYLNGKWSLAGYRTANGMYVTGLTNGVKYGFAVKAYVNGAWTNIVSSDIVYATPTADKADVMYADTESFISDDIFDIGIDDIDIGLPDIA